MGDGSDYRITKLEKGPLQRFKNQNLLLKKFGEVGLQVYKAITGKRTTKELRKDLGVEPQLFDQIMDFMQSAAMVDLQPAGRKAAAEEEREAPKEELAPGEEIAPEAPEEEPKKETPGPTLEELPPAEEKEEELPPLEEKPRRKPKEVKKEEISFEEIKPIEFEAELPPEEEKKEEKPEEKEEEEEKEEKEEAPEEKEEEEKIEMETEAEREDRAQPRKPETPGLSPIEKIISDKYGDIGLRVYALIDGQRTAEEIMRDTGLTEAKLVEMLDFMDEQGIIKLDYPKAPPPPPPAAMVRGPGMAPPPQAAQKKAGVTFTPMLEAEAAVEEGAGPVPSPLELPVKAPLDIVKTVQMKAKIMLKYGDKGGKVVEQMDGKNDVIDIALKLDIPLYTVTGILDFLMQNGMIIMKPLPRLEVRKKYGDDGYSVYKKYGKEGLMLYELIGKELTIKQMADRITTDKARMIDMFIFIHKVLGIELPIDRDMLAKQLGM